MDLALPWSRPGLETNKILPYEHLFGAFSVYASKHTRTLLVFSTQQRITEDRVHPGGHLTIS